MADLIEEALNEHLRDDVPLIALVNKRVHPMVAPQDGAKPYIVYQKLGGPRWKILSGVCPKRDARFQISCWAETYIVAKKTALAVVNSLDAFSGTMGTIKTASVDLVRVENEIDSQDDKTKLFRTFVDVVITHAE